MYTYDARYVILNSNENLALRHVTLLEVTLKLNIESGAGVVVGIVVV